MKSFISTLNKEKGHEKIIEYVKNLNIDSYQSDIITAMCNVWEVLKNKNNDEEILNELLDNHNLSKEIHRMIPPYLGSMSNENIFSIFKNSKTFFRYLKENYENETWERIEEEYNKLYEEYKASEDDADKYKEEVQLIDEEYENIQVRHLMFLAFNNRCNEEEFKNVKAKKYSIDKEHARKVTIVKDNERKLLYKFRCIEDEFYDDSKYPLHGLRKICNDLSIYELKDVDDCAGDKLSQIGLVGCYFNWKRKSGYYNTILYNVIMREIVDNNIYNKQQCAGRVGRLSKNPIIPIVYIDSAKVSVPDKVKEQIINGDSISFIKEVEHKTDTKKCAERLAKEVEEIVNSKYSHSKFIDESRFNLLIEDTLQRVFNLRHEIYCSNRYNLNKTNKCFTEVLKHSASLLKK